MRAVLLAAIIMVSTFSVAAQETNYEGTQINVKADGRSDTDPFPFSRLQLKDPSIDTPEIKVIHQTAVGSSTETLTATVGSAQPKTTGPQSSGDSFSALVDASSAENDKIRNIVNEQFGTGSQDNCGTSVFGATAIPAEDACPLASESGTENRRVYEPDGSLIVAYSDTISALSGVREAKFYLCNENAPEKVVFSNNRPYKCDTKGSQGDGRWRIENDGVRGGSSGDWDRVPRCQDGYDNDGDSATDFPADNGCSSRSDDTETVGEEQTCSPFIGSQGGDKVAFYDAGQGSANPLGDGCDYEVQESISSTDVLDTFRCTQQGSARARGGGDLAFPNDVERAARDFCSAVGNRENHLHSGSQIRDTQAVRSAIFSYKKEDIPYSPKAEDQTEESVSGDRTDQLANEFVENTDFSPSTLKKRCAKRTQAPGADRIGNNGLVYDGGFTLRRCETVHHAETEYTNGDPHAASVWSSRGMADSEEYEKSDNSLEPIDVDRADSWVAARPGGSSDVISEGGDIRDQAYFEGGFGGRCPGSGRWQYVTPSGPLYNTRDSTGLWRCGNPSQISADFFELNVRDYNEKHVGFRVTQEQVGQWKDTFSGLPGNPELKMDAACWPGRRNTLTSIDGSANTDLLTNITVDLNPNSDTVAALKLRDSNIPTDRYSCVYGFRQTSVNEGSLIPGNRDSLIGDSLVEGLSSRGAISSTGVAVDLNTEVEGVRRPGIPDDAMSSGDVREQQFLGSHNATNDPNVAEVSDPFADYSGGGGAAVGGRQAASRNPLEEYLSRS